MKRNSRLTGPIGGEPHPELLHLQASGDLLDLEEEPLVVVRGQGLNVQLLGCHLASTEKSLEVKSFFLIGREREALTC